MNENQFTTGGPASSGKTFAVDLARVGTMMPSAVVEAMLILTFAFVMTMGLTFVYLSSRHVRRSESISIDQSSASLGGAYFCRALFACNSHRWLAIRSGDLPAAQEALRMTDAKPCTWNGGLSRQEDHLLFLSPPVDGWVLAIGQQLPDPAEDVDKCYHFLMRLSQEIGEVHYYSANRALNHHAWVRTEWGQVIRAYAWAGQTLWNQGSTTLAEKKLGMICHDYAHGGSSHPGAGQLDVEAPEAANTEKLFTLAASWSIDPTRIDEEFTRIPWGVADGL